MADEKKSSPLVPPSRLRDLPPPRRAWDIERIAFVCANVLAVVGVGLAWRGFGGIAAMVLCTTMAWALILVGLVLNAATRSRR